MPAPTLTSSAISTWSDNVNTDEVTGTLSWNSGDRILVVGMTEDQGFVLSTPTATGLTFTAVGTAVTVANSCWLHVWQATAGSAGSGTITASRATSTGVAMRGLAAFAFGTCTGFVRTNKGGGAGAVNSTQTVSVTRTQANSALVTVTGDWSAGSVASVALVPAGGTQVVAQTNTGGAAVVGRWGDQGAAGTTNYGTTGMAGNAFTISAVEVLGTVSTSTFAPAEVATATGAANNVTVVAAVSTAAATAAGVAYAGTVTGTVVVPAEVAAATAAADTATVGTVGGGGAESLFTNQTPTLTDASDGTPGITVATTVKFAVAGQVSAARFFATTTVSGVYTVGLWRIDSSDPGGGTLLASKTMGVAPTGGAWNVVTFDAPVSVLTTEVYRIGVFSGAGRYVATTNYAPFVAGGGGLTNGNITAPANNANPVGAITVSQGVFRIDSVFEYPNTSGNGSNYFADVVFTADGASTTVSAEAAGGAGAAGDGTSVIGVVAEVATAAATSNQPTVSTSSAVVASAEAATATAAASGAAVSIPGGSQVLFTNQTPTSANNSDGTPGITVGTTLRFAVDGTVAGIRFYATTTVGGNYSVALYRVDSNDPGGGTFLASKALTGLPTAGTWNTVTFDTPVGVTAGTAYRATVFSSEGRYVSSNGFFATDLTNGDITADADGDTVGGFVISQGVFRIDASTDYPNSTFGSTNYFVDTVFVTGAPATVTPECATASGAALFDPGTETSLSLVSDAAVDAIGTAWDPALVLASGAESAAGSGAADQPAVEIRSPAAVATGGASAYDVAALIVLEATALAEVATAAAVAPFDPGLSVSVQLVSDEPVPATGTAYDPTVVVTFVAAAAAAEGAGTAYDATTATTVGASLSAASGMDVAGLPVRMSIVNLSAGSGLDAVGHTVVAATITLSGASSMTAIAGYADGLQAVAAEHAIIVRRPTGMVRRTIPAR